MRIFLIGFMGSGKTHWGERLAAALQMPFFDLDARIAEEEGMDVPEIFTVKGEEFFRYKEKECLEKLVEQLDHFVLSAGGGTPCFFNNIKFMKQNGKVIWLNTATPVLTERLLRERRRRPLLSQISESGLESYIVRKLGERKIYYEQADVMVEEEKTELARLIELFQVNNGPDSKN